MLFHKDIYLPTLNVKDETIRPRYSPHAFDEAESDGIILPAMINLSQGEIFELEVINNIPVKVCIRFEYSQDYDLIIVLLLESLIVKTVWLNHVDDIHNTLDKSRYEPAPKIKIG